MMFCQSKCMFHYLCICGNNYLDSQNVWRIEKLTLGRGRYDSIRKSFISCLSSRASVSPWQSYCRSQSAHPITRSFRGCRKWSQLIATLRCFPADMTSLWKQVPRGAPGNK